MAAGRFSEPGRKRASARKSKRVAKRKRALAFCRRGAAPESARAESGFASKAQGRASFRVLR